MYCILGLNTRIFTNLAYEQSSFVEVGCWGGTQRVPGRLTESVSVALRGEATQRNRFVVSRGRLRRPVPHQNDLPLLLGDQGERQLAQSVEPLIEPLRVQV